MPGTHVAALSPNTATSTPKDSPMTSAADDHVQQQKDSRLAEYQHSAIPEEDESVGTASEPAEPLTPTSDTAPFTHPFRHSDTEEPFKQNEFLPTSAPAAAVEQSRATVTRTKSSMKNTASPDEVVGPEKQRLGKRVGSFMRTKLHRTPSNKDQPPAKATLPPSAMVAEDPAAKTSVDGLKESPTPALNMPKYRRLSSFSLSAKNSPKSSNGNSPPSPGSPSSTISDQAEPRQSSQTKQPPLGHKHSTSSTGIANMNRSGPGITWAGASKESKRSRFRRRSVSAESVPKVPDNDATVGLLNAFSKPANEGVGLKARRLSVSLPDEFAVDSCELDKEFKSSSLMPGKKGKILGSGATAEVRIMARRGISKGEELVAVKMFRGREKDEDEHEYIMKIKSEYSIAKSLHHPNIVETVRLCTNRGKWNHVMEFCPHGELYSLVSRRLFLTHYSEQDRLCMFKQLLRGVDYLHAHGIAHRDIKLENLLMDKDGHLKISDFGVAEVFSGEHPGLRTAAGECGKNMGEIRLSKPGICGSLPYIAPEVLAKNGPYDPRPLDVWSCAVAFLTLTFGGSPWEAAQPQYQNYAMFIKGWDEWLPRHPDGQITDTSDGHPKCGKLFSMVNPPPLKRLLLKMLYPMPDKRITIRDALNSNCIKSIECCCAESYDDPAIVIDTSKCAKAQKMAKLKLHHHVPPPPEKKIAKILTHRFDMGDGW